MIYNFNSRNLNGIYAIVSATFSTLNIAHRFPKESSLLIRNGVEKVPEYRWSDGTTCTHIHHRHYGHYHSKSRAVFSAIK